MNPLIWSICIIAILTLWLRFNRSRFGDSLSPFALLTFGWLGPLLLRGFGLSTLEEPWGFEPAALLAYTTVALTATCLIYPRRLPSYEHQSIRQTWLTQSLPVFTNATFRSCLVLFFLISFTGYIYNEFVYNPIGIPALSLLHDPTLPRAAYHRWGKEFQNRSWPGYLAIPLYVQATMLYMTARLSSSKGRRLFFGGLSLVYPVMTLLKLSRIDFLNVLTGFIFVEYYLRRLAYSGAARAFRPLLFVKRHWHICIFIALVLAAGLASQSFHELRGGFVSGYQFQHAFGISIAIADPIDTFLAEAYAYFALPFENFVTFYESHDVSYHHGYSLGVGFFRPVLSLVGRGRTADEMLARIGFDPHTGSVNTYPFITLMYAESGILGVVAVPLIYGVFVNILYARFRRRPTFLNFMLYTHTAYGWLWLFAAAGYIGLHFYLTILFLVGMDWLCKKHIARCRVGIVVASRPLGQGVGHWAG